MIGHNHLFGDFLEIIDATGGLLTKVVQNIAEPVHANRPSLKLRLERYLNPETNPLGINGFYPIKIQALTDFEPEPDEHFLIGFTGKKIQILAEQLHQKYGLKFHSLVHPTAIISPTARLGQGVIVNAGSIVASGTRIKQHVRVNKGVIIGHDTVIEPYAVIQPGVRLAGHVRIGEGSVVGIGATVIEDLTIGDQSCIAAGAVVIHDVLERSLVAGVPAKVKKLTQ